MQRANQAQLETPLPTPTHTHMHTQVRATNCVGMRNMCWLLLSVAAGVVAAVSALETH